MHVKGKKITLFEKGKILELYRQGKTQDEIVSFSGVSKGRVNKTIKLSGITRPQNKTVITRPVTKKKVIVTSSVRSKVDQPLRPIRAGGNLTMTNDYQPQKRIVSGHGQSQVDVAHNSQVEPGHEKSRSRSKSFPLSGSLLIVFGICVVCVFATWIFAPEVFDRIRNFFTKTKETIPEIKKTFGFEGKSLEDLGLPIDNLPRNKFE